MRLDSAKGNYSAYSRYRDFARSFRTRQVIVIPEMCNAFYVDTGQSKEHIVR
jgi:hypothetical protein